MAPCGRTTRTGGIDPRRNGEQFGRLPVLPVANRKSDNSPPQRLFKPYGAQAKEARRGKVKIVGLSNAPNPWPIGQMTTGRNSRAVQLVALGDPPRKQPGRRSCLGRARAAGHGLAERSRHRVGDASFRRFIQYSESSAEYRREGIRVARRNRAYKSQEGFRSRGFRAPCRFKRVWSAMT